MTVAITIRNVPDELKNTLAAKAARAGKSMQAFLLCELGEVARRKTVDEWIEETRARVNGSGVQISAEEIVRSIREDRDDPDR